MDEFKDNLDLYEDREHELLEKLGRMEISDPNRKTLRDDLTAIANIRNQYAQTEQNRLNNNAQNDINEAKLIIEEQKVKNERERNFMMAGLTLFSTGLGAFLHGKSYHMDETGYAYKPMKDFAIRLIGRGGAGK